MAPKSPFVPHRMYRAWAPPGAVEWTHAPPPPPPHIALRAACHPRPPPPPVSIALRLFFVWQVLTDTELVQLAAEAILHSPTTAVLEALLHLRPHLPRLTIVGHRSGSLCGLAARVGHLPALRLLLSSCDEVLPPPPRVLLHNSASPAPPPTAPHPPPPGTPPPSSPSKLPENSFLQRLQHRMFCVSLRVMFRG